MSDKEPIDHAWRVEDGSQGESKGLEEQLISTAESGDRLRKKGYAHL